MTDHSPSPPGDDELMWPVSRADRLRRAHPWLADESIHCILIHTVHHLSERYSDMSQGELTSLIDTDVRLMCTWDEKRLRDRLSWAKEFFV